MPSTRHLVLVLGDQLDAASSAFDGFDANRDRVWMAEVAEESTHVWSHKARTALFLSAMRHFRDALRDHDIPVEYRELDDPANVGTLAGELRAAVARLKPSRLVLTQPGDYRVLKSLEAVAAATGVPLEVRPDRHFLCSLAEFRDHARGRKQLRLEFFYREVRRRTGILMDGDQPRGGQWNYDRDNRGAFDRGGPGLMLQEPMSFPPDATTRAVLALVERRFPDHPGDLSLFDWPVTPAEAEAALDDFIAHRLPDFGTYQDAMWTGRPYLYHSRLSAAMNLKLLDPRLVIRRAVEALEAGAADLPAVEGFVRQILGWREFVRGIYWTLMPEYAERNALNARVPLPAFYWTGDTPMNCLKHTLGQTLEHGYAHHIQRLMVTGLYGLLSGVVPREIHEWYLAVYVDAVEWVELPNVVGMSQFADGGVMGSKPYIASGQYIDRMSNYCDGCRYKPTEKVGPTACPFTTLYWDFLMRHERLLAANPRTSMQVRNLGRLSDDEKQAIRAQAATHRAEVS